jgi:hypothetical protein
MPEDIVRFLNYPSEFCRTIVKPHGDSHASEVERIFENGGAAIPKSAATFLPSHLISLHLPCDGGCAQRGREPALLRDHLQWIGCRAAQPRSIEIEDKVWSKFNVLIWGRSSYKRLRGVSGAIAG